jgi:hypothetical protein
MTVCESPDELTYPYVPRPTSVLCRVALDTYPNVPRPLVVLKSIGPVMEPGIPPAAISVERVLKPIPSIVDIDMIELEKLLIVEGIFPIPPPVMAEYDAMFVKMSSHMRPAFPSVVRRYCAGIGRFVFESIAKRLRRMSKSVSRERPFKEKGSILS